MENRFGSHGLHYWESAMLLDQTNNLASCIMAEIALETMTDKALDEALDEATNRPMTYADIEYNVKMSSSGQGTV